MVSIPTACPILRNRGEAVPISESEAELEPPAEEAELEDLFEESLKLQKRRRIIRHIFGSPRELKDTPD